MAVGTGNIRVVLDTKRLDMIMNGLNTKANQVLDVGASQIEAGWKRYIVEKDVIDTGAYLGSVGVREEHEPFERVISDGVEYGIYQEFGTSHLAARPCAGPAVEDERGPFSRAWEALFK